MNLTVSAYNIDSHKLFLKPAMVMEKVDVSVEKVNTKGGKQRDRMATKSWLWRSHQGARLQHHPCFPYLTDLWQEAYSTEDTIPLNLKKRKIKWRNSYSENKGPEMEAWFWMLWNVPHLLAVVSRLCSCLVSDSGGGCLGSEVLNTLFGPRKIQASG